MDGGRTIRTASATIHPVSASVRQYNVARAAVGDEAVTSPADRFAERPHRTTALLSVPVFFALVAEPVAALVDVAFVSRLGATESAALGTGTLVLSSVFWIFNFLAVGTQTEVARAFGAGEPERVRRFVSLACALSFAFGTVLAATLVVLAGPLATWMRTAGGARDLAVEYVTVRAIAAPCVLVMATCAGALRGLQRMRAAMIIAILTNGLNVLLDWWLIFGVGPFPALGVRGAALATTISHTVGAVSILALTISCTGFTHKLRWSESSRLLAIGSDMFVRTGMLTLFLLLTTRAANRVGESAAAAHQAIRTVWMFAALALDAYAATAQSLVGYFDGSGQRRSMRRVAVVTLQQSVGAGAALAVAMVTLTESAAHWLVPAGARGPFDAAWTVAACSMPANALAFATDGIHQGTGDFRYLRNAMLVSTAVGIGALALVGSDPATGLRWIWSSVAVWIAVRSVLGLLRLLPGNGRWS